ncbi:MAG TPA: NAD(P)-dependent oxidoreductase [Usitatibacter sp.]|nr:NAD(P)-dependent oxidoreductase [Usitatibacter sp.]
MRVGVIGVGAMGMGIARTLVGKGFEVLVRDLIEHREREAVAAGARPLAGDVDVLVSVVIDADQTRHVVEEHGGRAPAFMMCSTIAPADAAKFAAALHAVDVEMLDAPISGGPARAHNGTLSMMASGSDGAFEQCAPVIEAISRKCFRIGSKAGDGSRMKVVNNMLAAANIAAACESMAMASLLGLDLAQAAEVIQASSGASWMFGDRMPRALAGDYAPTAASRVLLKDVGLFVHEARKLGLTAPMAECAQEIFADTVARGYAEEDDAAVLKRYADAWGAAIPGRTR